MSILDKKRKKTLDEFVKNTIKVLDNLKKKSKKDFEKGLYLRMKNEITSTPLLIYDRKALNVSVNSVTFGEHVVQYYFVQKGKSASVFAKKYIRLPAWHIFYDNKISKRGAFTLWHEWAHFSKPDLNSYLRTRGIPASLSEETAADVLATVIAREFGYKESEIKTRSLSRTPFSRISLLVDKILKD